jgi:uncharacterized protein (DUF433 family)
MSDREIVADYPALTPEAIRAAIAYGAALAREQSYPLPPLGE